VLQRDQRLAFAVLRGRGARSTVRPIGCVASASLRRPDSVPVWIDRVKCSPGHANIHLLKLSKEIDNMTNPNIAIYVPAYGDMACTNTLLTTGALGAVLGARGITTHWSAPSFPDIAYLRNMCMTWWYDALPDSTHLLFIDADNGFAPQLVLDMLDFNEQVVGAVYPAKDPTGRQWVGRPLDGGDRIGDFLDMEFVGGGVLLIRRDAVDKMVKAYPHLIDTTSFAHTPQTDAPGFKRLMRLFDRMPVESGPPLSEDKSFCLRWRDIGGKVWGAIGHEVTHMGRWMYRGRFAQTLGPTVTAEPINQ
jgi:hypothetical protein